MDLYRSFVLGQAVWMVVVLVGLAITETFTLPLFFVLSFIGMLYIAEYTSPLRTTVPRWRRRLHVVLFGCFVLFLYLVLVAEQI